MSQYNEKKKNAPKPAEAAMRYYSICCNTRPVARKILQRRHYLKRCARIEFYKLLALYHADSKIIVVCVDSFNYFLLLHCWGCLRLNLRKTYDKNKPTYKKQKRKQEISTEASALVRLSLALTCW